MSRAKKDVHLAELTDTVANAKGIVFANYQGTKVNDLELLRKKLHTNQVSMRVTKNNLLRLVLRRNQIDVDQAILDQPLTMVASVSDEIVPAKLLKGFQKDSETFKVVGGIIGGKFLTGKEMLQLADLPSTDELRAKLVGVLVAPLSGLLRTLNGPATGLVSVLRQYQATKE